ncbi:BTB/POZ domain-containing protein 18 [Porphyrio hochstetteri]
MEQLGRELPLQGHRVVLELGGLKIRTLRKLVHFLYTAELKVRQEEVQEVLAAARHLRVTELESLQLRGGSLVRMRPQQQLKHSCPCPPRYDPPPAVGGRAEPSTANSNPGSTGVTPQGQPCSLATTCSSPGPVERVKLRKVETNGCWEVVQEKQPHTIPGVVAGGDGGVPDPQPPLDVGALEQAGRHSAPWQPSQAAWRKQGQAPPPPQQCSRQVVLLGGNPDDPEEEEVDVGTVEPCLPPGTICVWPCPSSESDEEVDVLT